MTAKRSIINKSKNLEPQ